MSIGNHKHTISVGYEFLLSKISFYLKAIFVFTWDKRFKKGFIFFIWKILISNFLFWCLKSFLVLPFINGMYICPPVSMLKYEIVRVALRVDIL